MGIWRLRRKRVVGKGRRGVGPRGAVIGCRRRSKGRRRARNRRAVRPRDWSGGNAREGNEGFTIERGRAVELQVVFSFKYIVEDTEASADAGFATASGTPRKSDPGSEISLVREIDA